MKKVKRQVKQLIKAYKLKAKILLGQTYKGHRNQPIVFILSTGRCGSTSIKDIFNQHQKFIAFHEDIRPLIHLSTELAEHPERQKAIYKELDSLFAKRLWEAKNGQIIVHSDHRLWNLVPYLSNYFPNAYFIHLIRNPYDSVKSFIQRDWHKNDDINQNDTLFDKHRLYGDRVKDVSQKAWHDFDQIDKCLWYWNYVNQQIHNQLLALNSSNYLFIKLETLEFDMNKLITPKFGIEHPFKFKAVLKNQSKRELKDDLIESQIKEKIMSQSHQLFLDYYPEFKLIKHV